MGESGGEILRAVLDRLDRQHLTDYPRGRDDHIVRGDAERVPGDLAHPAGLLFAVGVAGVGVAAVADDGLRRAILKVLARHLNRRALDEVLRIDGGGRTGLLAEDHGEIGLTFILADPAVDPGGRKPGRSGHAAINICEFHLRFLLLGLPGPCAKGLRVLRSRAGTFPGTGFTIHSSLFTIH